MAARAAHLDAAAFSHGHSDHMGGMTAILRNFHPREIWYAPNYPSHEVVSLFEAADRLHVHAHRTALGREV